MNLKSNQKNGLFCVYLFALAIIVCADDGGGGDDECAAFDFYY